MNRIVDPAIYHYRARKTLVLQWYDFGYRRRRYSLKTMDPAIAMNRARNLCDRIDAGRIPEHDGHHYLHILISGDQP